MQRGFLARQVPFYERDRLGQVENLLPRGVHLGDVRGIDGDFDGAVHNVVEIDMDLRDAGGFCRRLVLGFCGLVRGGRSAFIRLRRQWRGRVGGERNGVDAGRFQHGKIELGVGDHGVLVAAGLEVEVFAVRRPDGTRVRAVACAQAGEFARG